MIGFGRLADALADSLFVRAVFSQASVLFSERCYTL